MEFAPRIFGRGAPGERGRRPWRAALVLIVVAGLALLGYAEGVDLKDLGKRLSTMRDSSLDVALNAKVRSALALSRRVAGMKIEVASRSGIVTLKGRVPSEEARSIVEAIAGDTPGVGGVQDNLVVDPQAAATGYEQTLLGRIGDLETQVTLQERLRREPLLSGAKLHVDVDHGMVVLRGWAETDLERSSAQKIAQAVVGGEHVRNEIDVLGPSNGGQDRLARRVEFELYSTGAFDLTRIQVHSEAGRVEIQGSVRSEAERLLVTRLCEDVPGVSGVVNTLQVSDKSS